MDINSVDRITFSPTGTTDRIVAAIADGTGLGPGDWLQLTSPDAVGRRPAPIAEGLAIIGAPVYGGRLPREAVRRLQRVRGAGAPAVVVAVYGNRAYEDALLELRDLVIEQGFDPLAAGAFIGEHSYDSQATPIATGRPDARDLDLARAFGAAVRRKLDALDPAGELAPLYVPGDRPYRTWDPPVGEAPSTDRALCTLCGACAAGCPTGAIAVNASVSTDPAACILCSACVKGCPTRARTWKSPWVVRVSARLSETCRERKEPEVFV